MDIKIPDSLPSRINRMEALRLYCTKIGEYQKFVDCMQTLGNPEREKAYRKNADKQAWISKMIVELSAIYDWKNAPNPHLTIHTQQENKNA